MSNPSTLIFIFSRKNTPYETELEALMFLLDQIRESENKEAHNVRRMPRYASPDKLGPCSPKLLANFKISAY